jgi:hypothetical protein
MTIRKEHARPVALTEQELEHVAGGASNATTFAENGTTVLKTHHSAPESMEAAVQNMNHFKNG